ncbi:crossover junction endonuclease MUS81-like [Papaver somniferum]|uniref:crossover junction endonuclease MUS81-like n=1 Tax=Papaver somniferum TaxID=3469 RepID=UPI000E702246|nr:crossover junction endonuclease MUS81-like [Papaver somniferum]
MGGLLAPWEWDDKPILNPENEPLVLFFKKKRQEMKETAKGISEYTDSTLYTAYTSICKKKKPVRTQLEFIKIKGIGQWTLKLCKEFFKTDSDCSEQEDDDEEEVGSSQKGKRSKGKKRYLPQKNSVAYALLITLYKETLNGKEYMKKQELIDATEASGLSRVPIMPERGKGKPMQGGNSGNQWYTGWSCMGGLITKGLVIKASNPAKYMLTPEGVKAAQECQSKTIPFSSEEVTLDSSSQDSQEKSVRLGKVSHPYSSTCIVEDMGVARVPDYSCRVDSALHGSASQACSSSKSFSFDGLGGNMSSLMTPPLKFGERFKDVYNVILILDDREHFTKNNNWARSKKTIQNVSSEYKIQVEVRRLPVGDAIWIAQDKNLENEFVLDFIVERKEIDDLRMSIRDSRYKDQKLRILRCGVKKLIYLVEGDLNFIEAAEAIKTACFTTEILEGFDVHRTANGPETLRKYGYLTQAIAHYYMEKTRDDTARKSGTCPSYSEFIKKCEDLEKVTVSDLFGTQLMQVPQVTEEIALSVLGLYPTVLSLARAYSVLDGNVEAQEEMLKKQSNNLISGPASRNIYRLIWGD